MNSFSKMAQINDNLSNQGKSVFPESPVILLVDDNDINLKVLHQALEGHGYKLLVARSGEDALRISFMVCDTGDGFEQLIKKLSDYSRKWTLLLWIFMQKQRLKSKH